MSPLSPAPLVRLRRQVEALPGMNGRHDAIGGVLEVSRAAVLALIDAALPAGSGAGELDARTLAAALPGALHRAAIGCRVANGVCSAPHLTHSKVLLAALEHPEEPGYAAYVRGDLMEASGGEPERYLAMGSELEDAARLRERAATGSGE